MRCVKIVLILCIGWCAHSSFAEDISVSQSVDRSEVAYDGTAQLEITLTWKGSQFAYLFDKPLNPATDRLKVREFSSSLSTSGSGANEMTTKRYRYTLVPTSSGIGKVQPISISYLKWPDSIPGMLTTEELSINIGEKKTTSPTSSVSITTITLSVLGLLAMLGAVVVVVRGRARRHAVPLVSPRDVLLGKLDRLRSDCGGDFGKFQSGLYHLFGEFMFVRYALKGDTMTEEDISSAMNSAGMPYHSAQKIAKWYVSAREDRFRPLRPEPGAVMRLAADIKATIETL